MREKKGKLVKATGELQASAIEGAIVKAEPTTEELAIQVIQIMNVIAERMTLEAPHPTTAKRVRGGRTVSREFVIALAAMVESSPVLQRLKRFDLDQAREVLQARDAYRTVADRTAMLLKSMNYTIEARWADVVSQAMQTFTVAVALARDPTEGELALRLEHLRKLLGRKGAKKKKGEGSEE